ncbi:T9SS type A sorting domain-containing protein [Aurantibacillus circumpalustris]|uniref:T9SS type A sorting domain-containing protein n=1 Tax=Aurantibacillus circumpalustris TaxID=3036359 RepID=UPI00295B6A30|nr:T9SS type A sorting domain-containing protein [Aurantibacillus circumpalustris]
MKKLFTLIVLLISISGFSQPLVLNKALSFGGPYTDQGWPIVTDQCGNLYTAGTFSGTVDFDPGPSVYTLTAAGQDLYVLKFDPAGNFLWAVQLNLELSGGGQMTSLCLDPQQNIWMAGIITGTADLDPGSGQYTVGTSGITQTIYNKLDPSGNFISGFLYTTGLYVSNPIIKYDAAGNFIVCGGFTGTVDFDPGAGNFPLTSNGGTDVFVCKFSNNGLLLWALRYGGSLTDVVADIEFDSANNIVLTGNFNSTVDFDPGPGNFSLTAISSGFGDPGDAYVLKLTPSGNFLWAVSYGNPSPNASFANNVALDTLNNVYVGSVFSGTLDVDPGVGTYTLNSLGMRDDYFIKLDAGGNFLWGKQVGGADGDGVSGICIDKNNKLFAMGLFRLSVDFDPGPATYSLTSVGGADIFLLELDDAGNFINAKQFAGSSDEFARDLWLDNSGSLYFTGGFSVTADFDPGPSVYNLTSNGAYDVFVCKLSTCLDVPYGNTCEQNKNICSGQNTSITAMSTSAITWYASNTASSSIGSGPVLVTPTLSAGTYTYYAAAATCTADGTRAGFVLTVNANPSLVVTAQPATVCPGQSATLTVSGASTYSWSTTQLTPTISVSINASSVFSVAGTNTLTGCNNSKTVSVIYSNCTGINENSNSNFRIYPNPLNENLHLELQQAAVIKLYDQLGRLILSQDFQKGNSILSVSHLKEGIYFIQLNFGEAVFTQKTIKMD